PHRDHADRAPGPMDQLDIRGEEIGHPVAVDRVRVPAADLHDLVVAVGVGHLPDLAGERAAERCIPELVDELHPVPSISSLASAAPACTSTRSPGATPSSSPIKTSTCAVVPAAPLSAGASSSASQIATLPSTRISTTRIGIASSEQVMQCPSASQRFIGSHSR